VKKEKDMIQNVASVGVQNNANLVAQKKTYKTKGNIMAAGAGVCALAELPILNQIRKNKSLKDIANPMNPDALKLPKSKKVAAIALAIGGVALAIGSIINRSKANKIQEQ
jgi:hypothetical protein